MHKVQIDVGGVEVAQRGVECGFNIVRMVRVVPELGGDEEGGARDPGFFDRSADRGFGAIDAGGVDVAVASFQGGGYSAEGDC